MIARETQGGLRRRRIRRRRGPDQRGIYIELVDLTDTPSHKQNSQWKSSKQPSKLPKLPQIFPPINMFASIISLTVLALPILAVATPTPIVARDECNTGPIQCCNSTESANSTAGATLLALLGIVLQDTNVLLGIKCSPISVVGVGSGSACNASPVCCQNNNVGGIISIGCVPVIL